MAKRRTVKPTRRAARLAARHPRRTARLATRNSRRPSRVARGATKVAARNPRATRGGARLLGRSARGGTKLWAKGKTAKVTGRAGAKTGRKALKAKTAGKALRAAGRQRPARTRLVLTGGLAALGAYFLDPKSGKRRRSKASDKAGKAVRRGKSEAESKARHAEGVVAGTAQQATPGGGREPAEARLNDPSLARKVESEIFRDPDAPKGAVSVSVENGVVYLRGQVDDSGQRQKLGTSASQVEGVREVQNLLHGAGEPAPSKPDGGPGSGAA